MKKNELNDILKITFEDRKLSRTERKALNEIFTKEVLDNEKLAYLRNRVFEIARDELIDSIKTKHVLEWLEDLVKVIYSGVVEPKDKNEVYFSPGDSCLRQIIGLVSSCNNTLDICVYTVTDNRIVKEIEEAFRRGVKVRIISDNEKSMDTGSDVQYLKRLGIRVKVDQTPAHMHHKFAIIDRKTLINGSYNWTRSAAAENSENVVVSANPGLINEFQNEFDRLWKLL